MADLKTRETVKVTGKIKIDTYRAGFADAVNPYLTQLQRFRKLQSRLDVAGQIQQLIETIDDIRKEYHIRTAVECPNTVMDSPNYGIDLIIQQLVGITTYTLSLNYIEIGTGNTTPTISDTALTTPTNRGTVTFQQDYGTTDAIVQTIFSDSQLANGTYYEMGTFAGGTTTIGSGQLFNHALFGTAYTKTSGQDTTVQADFSFS